MLNFLELYTSGSVFETVAYGHLILLGGGLAVLSVPQSWVFERKMLTGAASALFCHYIYVVYSSGEYGFGVAEIRILETALFSQSNHFFLIAFDAQATLLWLFFSTLLSLWGFNEWVREPYSAGWNPFYDTKGFSILFLIIQVLLTYVCIGTCTYYVP